MKITLISKAIFTAFVIIIVLFVATGIFDVLLAAINPRFYSNAAFMAIYGVGGIFAALLSFTNAIKTFPEINEAARWSLIIANIIFGGIFFFPLAAIEGGEYEWAFKAFGLTLALGGFIFAKGKVE